MSDGFVRPLRGGGIITQYAGSRPGGPSRLPRRSFFSDRTRRFTAAAL